jgi:hypothetical protein
MARVAKPADALSKGFVPLDQDFCGSLMVNAVRLNGHFKFHWDEALGRVNSDNGARYLVKSWNEIKLGECLWCYRLTACRRTHASSGWSRRIRGLSGWRSRVFHFQTQSVHIQGNVTASWLPRL